MAQKDPAANADRSLSITRLFNAPRELVFEVWTNPEHIAKWWGPNGFTNTIQSMDVREGGTWSFIMHGPDGTDYPNRIVYQEVVKPERLVYLHGDDTDNSPRAFHVTVQFEAKGNKTLLTMTMVFATAAMREMVVREFGAKEGNKQTMDRMEKYLAEKDPSIPPSSSLVITRIFNAPAQLVFDAWTNPEHLVHWWGRFDHTLPVCEVDLQQGKGFRFCMKAPDGQEYWVSGTYYQIDAPHKLVFSCGLENTTLSHDALWTVDITKENGKTRLVLQQDLFDSTEAREGAEEGLMQCFDRLEEHVLNIEYRTRNIE